jgi:hypothetical protein
MTLSIATLSKLTFAIMTLSIKGLFATLNLRALHHDNYVECRILFIVLLSAIMLSAVMLSVIMLNSLC